MKIFSEFEKVGSDDQRMVWGYASTEDVDTQNDIVSRGALREAWGDYWGNVREMHKASAVGVVREHEFTPRGLYIGVYVGDDQAWHKVQTGIYKGFSIGGRALQRDQNDRRRITKLQLREISLVDRGANENARFELFKFDHEESQVAENTLKVNIDTEELDVKLAKAETVTKALGDLDEVLQKLTDQLAQADDRLEKLTAGEPSTNVDELLAKVSLLEEENGKLRELVSAGEKAGEEIVKAISGADEIVKSLAERLEKVEARPAGVEPASGAAAGVVEKDEDSALDPLSKLGDNATAEEIIKAVHMGGGSGPFG